MKRHAGAPCSTTARWPARPFGALAGAVVAAVLLSASSARALPEYGAQIPNLNSAGGCDGLCHGSGFADSQLYKDFAAAGFVWNATMANADSDGDGFSNGWELQNPAGNWVSGTANPGNAARVADPTNPGSQPPLPVAVTPSPIEHSEGVGQNGSEDFFVDNVGSVPFDYMVSVDETWMMPDTDSGIALPPSVADALVLLFTTGSLPHGDYMGTLSVTIPGIRPDRIPPVPVSLTVPEPGAIAAQGAVQIALALLLRSRRSRS